MRVSSAALRADVRFEPETEPPSLDDGPARPDAGQGPSFIECAWMAGVVVAIRVVLLFLDATPRFFLGDSESYLGTGLRTWMPPDRSWLYGLGINALLRVLHSLGAVLTLQVGISAAACLATALLLRSLGVRPWLAWAALLLQSLDPLWHYYDRSILTDAPGAAVTWVGIALVVSALHRDVLWRWTAAIPFFWAAVCLRTALLPLVVFVPACAFGLQLLTITRSAGETWLGRLRPLRGPSLLAAGVVLGLSAYAVTTGLVIGSKPALNPKSGYFLIGKVATLLTPEDFEGLGIADPAGLLARTHHDQYGTGDWQIYDPEGLALQIEKEVGSWQRAEEIGRTLARRSVLRNPVGFVRLVFRSATEYLALGEARERFDMGFGLERPLPDGMVASLRSKVRDVVTPSMVSRPSLILSVLGPWSHALPLLTWLAIGLPLVAVLTTTSMPTRGLAILLGGSAWVYVASLFALSGGYFQRYLLVLTPLLLTMAVLTIEHLWTPRASSGLLSQVRPRTHLLARPGTWVLAVLATSTALLFNNLGHTNIELWDESFHAIVARNLTKHPLLFTLYDQPWLPYDYANWSSNHVWLHKPPMAMWQSWISFTVLGVNALALRLPSLLGATMAVWLTYCIASRLFDRRVGVIAAFLQAFNPFLAGLVHGYRFADQIDIALLLWVEVSAWFLLRAVQEGRRRDFVFSGIAQGLAVLSKSYLGLITVGIAGALWLLHRVGLVQTAGRQRGLRLSDVMLHGIATVATITPWIAYNLIHHPREFLHENVRVLDHLSTNVEEWAAPWDRHLFDYMIGFYSIFYVAVLIGLGALIVSAIRHRRLEAAFVALWALGVVVPLTIASSKTPSMTLLAVPPLLIAVAVMVGRAWDADDWASTNMWLAAAAAMWLIPGGVSVAHVPWGSVQAPLTFMRANQWVLEQVLLAIVLTGVLGVAYVCARKYSWQRPVWTVARLVALLLSLRFAGSYVKATVEVTERASETPLYVSLGQLVQHALPQNACLFLDDASPGAVQQLMFYADRSSYSVWQDPAAGVARDLDADSSLARGAGGKPYLVSVSARAYDYPLVLEGTATDSQGRQVPYRVFEVVGPDRDVPPPSEYGK